MYNDYETTTNKHSKSGNISKFPPKVVYNHHTKQQELLTFSTNPLTPSHQMLQDPILICLEYGMNLVFLKGTQIWGPSQKKGSISRTRTLSKNQGHLEQAIYNHGQNIWHIFHQ